jgi:hypothetical protein
MPEILIQNEIQEEEVADEVSALIAVVRPILYGLLNALKKEVVDEVGGREQVPLFMLPRLYRPGDGDCGICFEYAVHDSIRHANPRVLERISDALKLCKVPGNRIESILFGAEKSGALQLIDTAGEVLTDESRLLTGRRHQPPRLKSYLNILASSFRRSEQRQTLPSSINGLWKADLFLGNTDTDRWVGTSVKINPRQLEGANGLRVGIVPASWGRRDLVRLDEERNLVVCPLPYDGAFMEVFYNAWGIVQQFIASDAQIPTEVRLPIGSHRRVAVELQSRRDFSVLAVIDALAPLAQPHLLRTQDQNGSLEITKADKAITGSIIAPSPTFHAE